MSVPTLYRITDIFPYLDREDEYTGLTLEEAASRMDDLTGVGADVILADFDEACGECEGKGEEGFYDAGRLCWRDCATCGGSGKRERWEWTDPESGREVVMRREVG